MSQPEDHASQHPKDACAETSSAPLVHLHDDDVERIAAAVVSALRRERLVDDIVRRVRKRLQAELDQG